MDEDRKQREAVWPEELPEGVEAELLAKVLSNPEMAALLTSLARSLH